MTWVTLGVGVGTAVLGGAKEKKLQSQQKKQADFTAAYEAQRQNKIGLVQQQVENAYNNPARQAGYNTFANALRSFYGTQLDRQKLDASRQQKFGLAKQGEIGSSQAVDRNRRLGDTYAEAALSNERNVQGSVAELTGQDEAAKNALKSEASQGLTLEQAGQRSSESLRQNLGTADVGARVKGIGNVFADTAATYKAIRDRNALAGGYNAVRGNVWGQVPHV